MKSLVLSFLAFVICSCGSDSQKPASLVSQTSPESVAQVPSTPPKPPENVVLVEHSSVSNDVRVFTFPYPISDSKEDVVFYNSAAEVVRAGSGKAAAASLHERIKKVGGKAASLAVALFTVFQDNGDRLLMVMFMGDRGLAIGFAPHEGKPDPDWRIYVETIVRTVEQMWDMPKLTIQDKEEDSSSNSA